MSNLSGVVLLAVMAVAATVAHVEIQFASSLHTGYWKQSDGGIPPSPPPNNSDECRHVTTKIEMEGVLRGAGWDFDDGVPDVSWETDMATVVTPDEHHATLEFYGLFRRNSEIELSWGWREPADPKPVRNQDGTLTISFLARVAMTQIAVVSYARRDVEGLDVNCRVR